MWIASKLGFYSIVQKTPGEWHVRARTRDDLVRLAAAVYTAGVEIEEWPAADYRWRLIVHDPAELGAIFQALAETIDYSNFKSEVGTRPDQRPKLGAYHTLWSNLYAIQQSQRDEQEDDT